MASLPLIIYNLPPLHAFVRKPHLKGLLLAALPLRQAASIKVQLHRMLCMIITRWAYANSLLTMSNSTVLF